MSEVRRHWPEELVGTGELVVYLSDYAALGAELAKLEAAMPRLMQANYDLRQERDAALAECERLRRLLEFGRDNMENARHSVEIRTNSGNLASALVLAGIDQWLAEADAALSAKTNNDGVV